MERAGLRIGIVGLAILSTLMSALFAAVAVTSGDRPQRVGVHLEFPAGPSTSGHGAGEEFMGGMRRSLPRLLATAQATKVSVKDVDASTLEVTFVPPQPWSSSHGARVEGDELVPDGLRTLLTSSRDVRVLEIVDLQGSGAVERDRAARLLDHHPERAPEAMFAALHDAGEVGHTVAWMPREGSDDLVSVLVEGSHDRQITLLDIAAASRGSRPVDLELSFDSARKTALGRYAAEIAGKRVAIVVDGAITCIGRVEPAKDGKLAITGEQGAQTPVDCATIESYVREPLAPRAPRITRSWIVPKGSIAGVVGAAGIALACAIFGGIMVWILVRDVRRGPAAKRAADWSSSA
jgi:hypothetical protein